MSDVISTQIRNSGLVQVYLLDCLLVAQEYSRSVLRASLWEYVRYDFGRTAPVWSFKLVMARFFKHCSAWMIRWETMGLLEGHDGLLLGLRCDVRDPRLHSEGLKRGGFELSDNDAECSVFAVLLTLK